MGAAQHSGEARLDGSGRGSGDDLLLDVGGEVAQSSGVPRGADPELLELVLGVSQLVFEETKTVWGRSRGWSSIWRRLRGFPHAVCHAAVGPPNCLRSRGRGEGDEDRGRVGARLSDQEGPNQQAGETPWWWSGLVGIAGLVGCGGESSDRARTCTLPKVATCWKKWSGHVAETQFRPSRLHRRWPGARVMCGGGGNGP